MVRDGKSPPVDVCISDTPPFLGGKTKDGIQFRHHAGVLRRRSGYGALEVPRKNLAFGRRFVHLAEVKGLIANV